MIRAQANLYESLPVFIGGVLVAHITGHDGALTAWGARLFFWGRLAYIPAYAWGLVPWRTLIFAAATGGLALVLLSSLSGKGYCRCRPEGRRHGDLRHVGAWEW